MNTHIVSSITKQNLSWLRGSAAPSLANNTKRYKLYKQFWKLLKQLGLWSHPVYASRKSLLTTLQDPREVMPECDLDEVRRRYPNPQGIPYTDYIPT
jgi:hypothetical protein